MSKLEKQDNDWVIPVTKYNKHFSYPSLGTVRNIVARRNENGANTFLLMIHGRHYIDIQKFKKWMSEQGSKN